MSQPDLSIARIHDLARRMEKSNPADAREQSAILESLKELYAALSAAQEQELARHVEAAGLLSSYIARMGALAGKEVIEIAARLLRTAAGLKADKSHQLRVVEKRPGERIDRKEDAKDLVDDMLLGQILLRRGQVTEEHIAAAVKIQSQRKVRFGDALIEIGAVDQLQVQEALSYQEVCVELRNSTSDKTGRKVVYSKDDLMAKNLRLVGDILLGQVMVERGLISQKALDKALESQRASGMRIGEALVQTGACNWDQVESGLRLQAQRRKYR